MEKQKHKKKPDDHKDESFLEHALDVEREIQQKISGYREHIFKKVPFLFLSLSTLGGVSVFYAFEKMIDRTPYLADNPLAILIFGFALLLFTGALYTKLR